MSYMAVILLDAVGMPAKDFYEFAVLILYLPSL